MQIALTVMVWIACQAPPPAKTGHPARPTGDIDFWRNGSPESGVQSPKSSRRKSATPKPESDAALQESIFAEPVRMPDGRFAIYVPPRPVLAFLEQPTRENARGYLAWQEERSSRMAAALALLEQLKLEEATDDSSRESNAKGPKSKVVEDRLQLASNATSSPSLPKTGLPKSGIGHRESGIRLTYFRQPD